MKAVILAGGLGTRISEETYLKPKPMVEIGGKPILWHILKIFSAHGINEFVICCGYKGYVIKEYFANYFLHNSDVTIDLSSNSIQVHKSPTESIKVTLVETGVETMTAGRLKRVQSYVGSESFMLTYGDGLCDVNLTALLAFHKHHGKTMTMTAIQPAGRFGLIDSADDGTVNAFTEKPKGDGNWINGGFFILEPKVFDYLSGEMDGVMWEQEPMQAIISDGGLRAFKHTGFWKAMDTLRDKVELENLWNTGRAKWSK
jgi:glucose-1-phosphate cytidylyltransferase